MSDFLDQMASSSKERARIAKASIPQAALEAKIRALPPAPPLNLSAAGFDVIAELKLRSPAVGALAPEAADGKLKVLAYARGGAAAISVLTEPSRFDGELAHLEAAHAALAPLKIPAMRKDFLVDSYQLAEARAAGAGGALLIVRMLSRPQLTELMDAAAGYGLFVLLEAFDEMDLEAAEEVLSSRPRQQVLVGVNCRDLQTLQVVPSRFERLAPHLPRAWPAVAESGVNSAADARRVKDLGFSVALIGTALMRRDDPAALLEEIFAATRTVQS
jgi:indole-3-glycerol phosphate synthase